jgi:hypothetical protein
VEIPKPDPYWPPATAHHHPAGDFGYAEHHAHVKGRIFECRDNKAIALNEDKSRSEQSDLSMYLSGPQCHRYKMGCQPGILPFLTGFVIPQNWSKRAFLKTGIVTRPLLSDNDKI